MVKKSPESGKFRAVFGWTATAPIGCERAQTGAFLAATGAVCGEAIEQCWCESVSLIRIQGEKYVGNA